MARRIIVSGSRGLLGSTLVRMLSGRGELPIPLISDVIDADALKAEIGEKTDWIIHTAAKTDVADCERHSEEAFAVNTEGTRNVIAAAQNVGARVLYISTASVFDGTTGDYKETDVPQPHNVYNKSKAKGEEYVAAYAKGTTVRLNLIGIHPDGSRGQNFMEWLVDSFAANKDMTLFDDVRINPLSNWTVARLIADILEMKHENVLHLSSMNVRSKAEIGEMVARHFPRYTGTLHHASVESISDGVPRPKASWINGDYTKEVLKYTMPTIEDEVEEIFRHV